MKNVAVFFGGRSTEHDVSIVTALSSVIKPLELSGQYNPVPVYITRDGAWYSDERLKDIGVYSTGAVDTLIRQLQPIGMRFDKGLTLLYPAAIGRTKTVKIDVAFPAMHGTNGEDGSMMGMLEMAGIPYVGCTMPASVLAMDKVLAKIIASEHGIATPKFIHVTRQQVATALEQVCASAEQQLMYPLFIKPAHLGSSIGISRAMDRTALGNGLEVAAHYDDTIIIEEAVQNLIEVTLPIIGNDEPTPALLERPMATAGDFFDFDTKYLRGGKKGSQKTGTDSAQGYSELPAKISETLASEAFAIGLAVYKALGCTGIARVDMLIDERSGKVYFNEVNPLPGSLYMHNWRQAGISSIELVSRLIVFAEERYAAKQAVTTSFDTNFLNSSDSGTYK